MKSELPEAAQLRRLACAAANNAADITSDGEVLLQNRRWARSYALGILALEELGKFALCGAAATWAPSRAQEFWAAFRRHEAKLAIGRTLTTIAGAQISEETLGALAEAVSGVVVEHRQKLHGIYVDVAKSGEISLPKDISSVAAEKIIGDVRTVLGLLYINGVDEFDDDLLTSLSPVLEAVVLMGS